MLAWLQDKPPLFAEIGFLKKNLFRRTAYDRPAVEAAVGCFREFLNITYLSGKIPRGDYP
jgi:hypothetical protein